VALDVTQLETMYLDSVKN